MMFVCFQVILTFLITTRTSEGAQYKQYSLSANYNKHESPSELQEFKEKPFVVSLKLLIQDIISVKEFQDILQLEMLMRMIWKEPRVTIINEEKFEKDRRYPVDQEDANNFWIPEICVLQMSSLPTEKSSKDLSHLQLQANKTMLQIQRLNLVIKCRFDFELYPLDIQHCKMDFMNLQRSAEDLVLEWWWKKPPVVKFKKKSNETELILPKYTVQLSFCHNNFFTEHMSGNVSTLRLWLILKRQLMAHILETYVPTGLFVAMSWGSFLVKPEIVPGRMVLLVTNLLSLVTLFESSRDSAPPAVGIKFVDIWLLSCIGFVFLALLEYTVILFKIRNINFAAFTKPICRERVENLKLFSICTTFEGKPIQSNKRSALRRRRKITLRYILKRIFHQFSGLRELCTSEAIASGWNILDQMSLVFFPLMFFLFNIIYWRTVLGSRIIFLSAKDCPVKT